jgi:uncharacterized protein YebE (UPF0316 family)
MLTDNIFVAFILIFGLRICDVSMGTVRTVFIMQGRKLWATIIGFFEVLIFITAIREVMGNLDNPVLMVAYAGGFAAGTMLGLLLEEKLAFGQSQLRIFSRGNGLAIARKLWDADFGATVVPGIGRDGPVDLVFSITKRHTIPEIVRLATEADKDCVVNINDSRYLYRGHIGHHNRRK